MAYKHYKTGVNDNNNDTPTQLSHWASVDLPTESGSIPFSRS